MALILYRNCSKFVRIKTRVCNANLKKCMHSTSCLNIKTTHRPYEKQTEETDFGFERVSFEEKTQRVQEVFTSAAKRYDIMNDLMSGFTHRLVKDCFMATLDPKPGTKLLDVAGGTGDIAFRFLKSVKSDVNLGAKTESEVTVFDINNDMLQVGKKRAEELGYMKGISWMQGDAQNLPYADNQFDAYTIAFGIRNVARKELALQEAFRVLRPGGRFLCLEFSSVNNRLLKSVYDWYSFNIIPVIGQIVARDWKSYQYLVESIRQFPNQETFKQMIEDAGFQETYYTNVLEGIYCIHSGFKL